MHSRVTDRRNASKCQGKWPDQTLDQAFGLPEVLAAVSTSRLSCKRAGKTRTLMPVWDSSGESRFKSFLPMGLSPDTLHEIEGFVRGGFEERDRIIEILCQERYAPGELDETEVTAAVDAAFASLAHDKTTWP